MCKHFRTHLLLSAALALSALACGGSPGGEGLPREGPPEQPSEQPSEQPLLLGTIPFASVQASEASPGQPVDAAHDGRGSSVWQATVPSASLLGDLGDLQPVDALIIAWPANQRTQLAMQVSVSEDGQAFSLVLDTVVDDLGQQPQTYEFAPVSARYVRVTFESMGSVPAVAEFGFRRAEGTVGSDPEPSPPAEPTAPVAAADPFGVTMIHPTRAGGETWFLSSDPMSDPRFNPQDTLTQNADGSWKIQSTQVRMGVYTSTGYDPGAIQTYERNVLAAQGYMQAPNDWRNVEMTGFVKVNSTTASSENFSWYARGGRHTDSLACEGSSYKGGFHYDGRTRWQKESWHVSYDQTPYQNSTSSLVGRWVGLKAVMRNISVEGSPAVQLELWLNDNADQVTWEKVYEVVDDGTWGGDATHCGGSEAAMPITWGGPTAAFRWDGANDVDFKWMSVREIE